MPPVTFRLPPAPFARLRRAIGVTRVARVTGLDRTGVEVACAIRPRGHVLQVSNGKGERFAQAARGAVLEAAELAASEAVPPGRGALAVVEARDLLTGARMLLPARAVHCPPPGSGFRPLAGPEARWTSNGMGAHPVRAAALLHAVLEAVERDQLARALPHLWTRRAVAVRMLDPRTLPRAAPRTARLADRLRRRGYAVFLFDLTPDRRRNRNRSQRRTRSRALGLPVAGALLVDPRGGPVPVAAGYAAGLAPDAALRASLLEAAQSRLTDIHGARQDIAPMAEADADALIAFCQAAQPRRSPAAMPRLRPRRSGPAAALASVLDLLRRAGAGPVAAADLALPVGGVHVVKVVVGGFRLTELL